MFKKSNVVYLLLSLFVFSSCEKEDNLLTNDNRHDLSTQQQEDLIKVKSKKNGLTYTDADLNAGSNSFDSYSNYYEDFISELEDSLAYYYQNNISLTETEVSDLTSTIQENYESISYPSINSSNYGEEGSAILGDYFEAVTIFNLDSVSNAYEGQINSSSLTTDEKNVLLSIISQHKFSKYYSYLMVDYIQGLEKYDASTVFRVCLGTKAQDTFGPNGNIVDQGFFIATAPASFGQWVASCAWDALF